jgi:hypothetical protein
MVEDQPDTQARRSMLVSICFERMLCAAHFSFGDILYIQAETCPREAAKQFK